MGVEARQVLEDKLGGGLGELGDIVDYLISVVEEASNDVEEAVETLTSLIDGAGEFQQGGAGSLSHIV
jgi:hypothetical protein